MQFATAKTSKDLDELQVGAAGDAHRLRRGQRGVKIACASLKDVLWEMQSAAAKTSKDVDELQLRSHPCPPPPASSQRFLDEAVDACARSSSKPPFQVFALPAFAQFQLSLDCVTLRLLPVFTPLHPPPPSLSLLTALLR